MPGFTLMVLLTTAVTGISTPLIRNLYNPTRPFHVNKRRTIQHHPPNTALRLVACIHDQESAGAIIKLLHASNPTPSNPFEVFALRLVELVGRACPVHQETQQQDHSQEHASSNDHIHNAFLQYQESRGADVLALHSFTAVTARQSMFQDVCELALSTKATLILIPFHREFFRAVNSGVLAHAPCSVGLLVDKGSLVPPQRSLHGSSTCRVAVLFMGGADAREALAFADRLGTNLEVSLTVVRFLSYDREGDDEMERKLDDGIATRFWVNNEGNDRVAYREAVVRDGEETIGAIRAINEDCYDLWIVGRKQGMNPVLVQGLSNWSENHELGIVGDFIASEDFGCTGSVLVVQQQQLSNQPLGCKVE